MPRLRKYWLLGQEHVWTDSWLIFHVAQQLVTGDASCLLMEAGFHPASCGLRPRPREGFKGVLSSGCYGSLWGDHRGWGCNELVKFLAVPVTGDYIREIHIKCVFISHPSPQEPLRSFYPIIRLAVEDCACWEQAYQLEHDFFDG